MRKDYQGFFYHQTKLQHQNRAVAIWAHKLGITTGKIQNHPCISDVALLLDFDEHITWFTQKDTEIWTHCWQWCYKEQNPLTAFHKRKLLSIIQGIEYRTQQYQNRQIKKQHIQARLQRKQNKLAAV